MHNKKKIDKEEIRQAINNFKILAISTLVYIGIGVTYYHRVEGWTWIDALYFCVVSLTTVGYGDLTPQTQEARLFTVFYLLIGIGIITAFVSNLFKVVVARRELRKENSKKI